MARRFQRFPILEGAQKAASDPQAHAALTASAGTGKTQVLTARVLRLLLQRVAPETILCLTFTKAGAAEMANRIGARLAAWVRLDDAALRHELFALDEANDPPALQRARRLFARVLEAPGSLRIQTIHSFAQTLLASFPAEAGISPGFQPLEGRGQAELTRRTLATLLADAEAADDKLLLADVQALSLRLGEQGAETYLLACAEANADIVAIGDPSGFEAQLRSLMGVPEGDIERAIAQRLALDGPHMRVIERLLRANRGWGNGKKATAIVANLEAFLSADGEGRAAMLDGLGQHIITAKGEPCKESTGQTAVEPDYAEIAAAFGFWWTSLLGLRSAAGLATIQAAGLRAGARFAAAYAAAKRAAGLADFDDLIRWTRALFAEPGMGAWVRYKLDRQTDHILVDEAQDTNSDQWAIVDALAAEFFTGEPEAEGRLRTLFMVGDHKQAIYSFQGSDPREFKRYCDDVAGRAFAAEQAALDSDVSARAFRDLSIDASFRSAPAVLETVDSVLAELGHEALGLPAPPNRHSAAHEDLPGRVELWPPFVSTAEQDDSDAGEEGWIDEAARRFADAIAGQVATWIDEARPMASTGRPLAPGDILILVRSRNALAALIVARLYARGVPVAGIDRLLLSKPLAVRDLLSAIAFAVQPTDDLNLAGLLVSPLLGWDQDQLFALAHDRGKASLWGELERRRDEGGSIAEAHATLGGLLAMADHVSPARFLETILSGPLGGRRKLIARLGIAARDPIEELVAAALEFERVESPSLDRFLAWFASGEVEVKRDASAPANTVRVMTVHGAKGLEAPLVILADATHDPARAGGPRSTISMKLGGERPVPLVRPRADERVAPFAAMMDEQKALDLEEHWRLLYVGLTRAKEYLVVAGLAPKGKPVDNSWHSLTQRAMIRLGASACPTGAGEGLCWEGRVPARPARLRKGRTPLVPLQRPDWLDRAAPEEERPPRPLAPSSLGDDQQGASPPSPAQRAAARRGSLLHSLFERLPGVAPEDRARLADRWLARAAVTEPVERGEIIAAALGVIEHPRFAALFSSAALAEAPIAATLADGRVIAGTVDRLLVEPDRILVVDFKTGRNVPGGLAEVPTHHAAQMAAYAAALRIIFPGRKVEAALLYSHGPSLIALDG